MITEAQKQKMLECIDMENFCDGIDCDDCPLNINCDCDIDRIYGKILAIKTAPTKLSKDERKELALKKYVEQRKPFLKEYEEQRKPLLKEYEAEIKKIDEENDDE